MIADKLVLHHEYNGSTAYDLSEHNHHGHLEHAHSGGGVVTFAHGSDCIRVRRSKLLTEMRAVRTSVRFKLATGAAKRRHNLIEGYLSFAFMINPDGSLQGTIHNRAGGWFGATSAPGLVTPGSWHEAMFVHDGFSACRIDLDGVTVAESFDVMGPVSGVSDPYGIAIGHWPDPGDQYTFEGEIASVRLWIDDPHSARRLIDPCCIDREAIDELIGAARASGIPNDSFDSSMSQLYDAGHRVFGRMASSTEADRDEAQDLARRFMISILTSNRQEFNDTLVAGAAIAQAKMSEAEIMAEFNLAIDALSSTPFGPLAEAVRAGPNAASAEEVSQLADKLGVATWLDSFCFGWAKPTDGAPRPDPQEHDKPDTRPPAHQDNSTDPTTDGDPGAAPPGWGTDGIPRNDGTESTGDDDA